MDPATAAAAAAAAAAAGKHLGKQRKLGDPGDSPAAGDRHDAASWLPPHILPLTASAMLTRPPGLL